MARQRHKVQRRLSMDFNGFEYAWLFLVAVAWTPSWPSMAGVMVDFSVASLLVHLLPWDIAPVVSLAVTVLFLLSARATCCRPTRLSVVWLQGHVHVLCVGGVMSIMATQAVANLQGGDLALVWTCVGAFCHTGLVAMMLDWTNQRSDMVVSLCVWFGSQIAAMVPVPWYAIGSGQVVLWLLYAWYRRATATPQQRAQSFVTMQPVHTVDEDEKRPTLTPDDSDTFIIGSSGAGP
jgi:hypothetical protein